ncbi:MAG: EAL domain-containing protein [Burkholderiales bacterium]|jgi:diguanylate cyclase (GGDEF)-like protein/PAS domain S-box-containing protein
MTNGEGPPAIPGARSRPRRPSLARKFIALSGSLVLLTSTSIALFVVRKAGDEGRRTLLRHGLQTAELLAQNAEYAVYTEDPGALEALTSVTAIDGDVAYVVVTNAAGQTLAHKERGDVLPPPARAELHQDRILHEERVSAGDRQHFIDIVAPVKSGGASLGRVPAVAGYVRLGLSLAGLERSARAFMEVVAGLTSLLILLGVVIVYVMARRTVAPIEKLRLAAHAIGEGRLDVQIEETGTTELADLARAFEAMRGRLRESRVTLETQAADLRESQERYALAARAANDGLWDWNLETGEAYFSPRWRAMLGLPESERVAGIEEWFRLVHAEDRADLRMQVDRHLQGDSAQVSATYRVSCPDGERWMLCRGLAVRDAAGKAVRLAGSQTDITAQKQAEDQLIHDALHDSLTGLPNRALFVDRLHHALRRAGQLAGRRREHQFAVLFVDLDRFKVINDSLGHVMGDRLLVEVARRIAGCLRPGDTAARLGGDEFAVLLESIDEEVEAKKVAERLVQRVAEPVVLEGRTIYTAASVGVTLAGGHSKTPEEVLRDADIAMYHAKRQGGTLEVFDPSMSGEALGRMGLENDLRGALDAGQLCLHYQPVVCMRTRRLEGFEALLRWRHPQRGLVPPGEFISILEETGLIVGVGRFVLREACLRLREWIGRNPGRKGLRTSVNVSAAQFTNTSVAGDVRAALRDTGLPAANLAIEITESAFLANPTSVARELEEIRSLGVGIYLDDFGTGYSSLAYLTRFPIDYLKVDGSFVGRMNQHRADREVVRAIAAIAHNLGMGLIAEGVEAGDQLSALRDLGCELGQGWLFSPAVDSDQAERLIETWSGDDLPAEVA